MQTHDPKNKIAFRLYRPKDYEGFLACIDDFYHGGYPYKEFLDPAFLQEESEAGNMILTVATNEDGKIVGTSAALRASGAFKGSVLLLLRCVLSECRGQGIGSKQELFLFEKIAERFPDTLSLYADVMTHDPASQITLSRNGFVLCGLRMMLYKNEVIVPALPYARGTKMTQAIYCKAVTGKSVALYDIPKYHDVLASIYEELGTAYTFLSDGGVTAPHTVFSAETNEVHQKTEFVIETVGDDIDTTLMRAVQDKQESGHTMVAYLNLCHAGCTAGYEKLVAAGFFFSGMKPLSANGEYLVLSHVKNCVCSFENVKVPANKQKFLDDIVGGMGK